MTKDKIVEQLEKLGYEYGTELYDDGTICTYKFIRPDCMRNDCYWEVAIEDHTKDDGEDWLIFVRYHDPDEKDWFGNQRDISGCVEFEAMKLIVEFTEILKCEADMRGKKMIKHIKEEKLDKLKGQLSIAGDRRDWDACERIEKEIEELERD